MIVELRTPLYTYLKADANDFITLLGADNLKHKRPLNDADFPYCVFEQIAKARTIDSGNTFPRPQITFSIYDGSNDGVDESTISMARVEQLVKYLDDLLDLKTDPFPVTGYKIISTRNVSVTPAPTVSNATHGVVVRYEFYLQKRR